MNRPLTLKQLNRLLQSKEPPVKRTLRKPPPRKASQSKAKPGKASQSKAKNPEVDLNDTPLAPLMQVNKSERTYNNANIEQLPDENTYENTEYKVRKNPYEYMGILFNYALRYLVNPVRELRKQKKLKDDKSRSHTSHTILDRFREINKRIDAIYKGIENNLIYEIFKNTLHNQVQEIKNIELTEKDILTSNKLTNELNYYINLHRNYLLEQFEAIKKTPTSENINSYMKEFERFYERYLTNGIMQMISPLYKNVGEPIPGENGVDPVNRLVYLRNNEIYPNHTIIMKNYINKPSRAPPPPLSIEQLPMPRSQITQSLRPTQSPPRAPPGPRRSSPKGPPPPLTISRSPNAAKPQRARSSKRNRPIGTTI